MLTETTADTGFALILATARRVVELANMVRDGQWTRNIGPAHFGSDVHGKTLGIIGMGRIGEALAQRGHFGSGMPVIYHSHSPKPAVEQRFNAQYRSLAGIAAAGRFCLPDAAADRRNRLIGADQCKLIRADQAFGFGGQRQRQADEIGLLQQSLRLRYCASKRCSTAGFGEWLW